ncbi:CED-6 protein, partial [Aphelenchoides avenae]
RVVELELENNRLKQENSQLKQELAAAFRSQSSAPTTTNGSTPPLPNTPIPPAPANPSMTGADSPVFPIVPPPNRHPRRSNGTPTKLGEQGDGSLNAIFARERDGPDVGTKLQNLQLERLEDVFDDEFDPRAHEKPKKESKSPEAGSSKDQPPAQEAPTDPTIAEFEAMLKRVDQRLAEMGCGFQSDSLATGDTGDTCRDLESEEVYHTPKSPASNK